MIIQAILAIAIAIMYFAIALEHGAVAYEQWQIAHGSKAGDKISNETFRTLTKRALKLCYLAVGVVGASIILVFSYCSWMFIGPSLWPMAFVSAAALVAVITCMQVMKHTKEVSWGSSSDSTGITYYVFAD